jgi:hypothetical protein
MIPQGLRALWCSEKSCRSTHSALNDAHVCGTGHSRLSLLCRVLAEGESAPSARKFTTCVKLECDPDQNPKMRSKRDVERSPEAVAMRPRAHGGRHSAGAALKVLRARRGAPERREGLVPDAHQGGALPLKH